MSRRIIYTLVALASLLSGALGAIIGFTWHAPGRPSTWADIRAWATFAVVVLGFSVAAHELNLQRRQFADEAARNAGRDELLDLQRRELRVAQLLRERAQAESVRLQGVGGQGDAAAILINDSTRPIRDAAFKFDPGDGELIRPASIERSYPSPSKEGKVIFLPAGGVANDDRVPSILPGTAIRVTFQPTSAPVGEDRFLARFTDDAGLHWQLDHHLHLVRLDNRDDW